VALGSLTRGEGPPIQAESRPLPWDVALANHRVRMAGLGGGISRPEGEVPRPMVNQRQGSTNSNGQRLRRHSGGMLMNAGASGANVQMDVAHSRGRGLSNNGQMARSQSDGGVQSNMRMAVPMSSQRETQGEHQVKGKAKVAK
jgi:hypothetical protein